MGPGTADALAGFAAQYGIDVGDATKKPDSAAVATIMDAVKAKLDAAYAAYPTKPLPKDYFVGAGSQWFFINELGRATAIVNRDGHATRLRIANFYAPADGDAEAFRAAGVKVVRLPLGMEGALFYDKCKHVPQNSDPGLFDACYSKAYAEAKASKWTQQIEALSHFYDNEVVKRFVDGVAYWNKAGFNVMVVPSDFYTGRGSHFNGTDTAGTDALFHTALMNDQEFQAFFPRFVGAVVNELKQRGLTNVSVQTANEPRFCGKNGVPTRAELQKWTSIETAEIDQIRRVAPRISIVSSATRIEGVLYFGSPRSYSSLARIMPRHPEIDDIAYSIHLYNPDALMVAEAGNALYQPGTTIHYPYQRIPESAARNNNARYSIKMYNRTKPDAKYFKKVFRDIAAFSAKHKMRVIITEMNIPNPSRGIPRKDRIKLLRDLITDSKQYDVPVIRMVNVGAWSLSSCPESTGIADHRFDPALLNLIAFGNSVPGAKPDAPIEPLEATCGPQVKIMTDEIEDHSKGAATWIDSIFRSSITGPKSDDTNFDYNIRGNFLDHNFVELNFTMINPALDGDVPSALRACSGVSFPSWDGRNHLKFSVLATRTALQAQGLNCILKNTKGGVAALARLLGMDFKQVATDMVTAGGADEIANDNLKQWVKAVAGGKIVIEPPQD